MKRILAVLCVLAMLPFSLASCSKEAPEGAQTQTESQTEKESQGEGESESKGSKPIDSYVEMITYNIAYYEATAQNMTVYYPNQSFSDYTIEKRAERLISLVRHYVPDVLALQEVNRLWWPYLITNDESIAHMCGYEWAGNLSTLNNKNGSGDNNSDLYNLLFWNPETMTEIKSGVFRLTDTAKNANRDRMCTYAILKNNKTGIETLYASTHLCTQGNEENKALNLAQSKKLTQTLVSLAEGRMIVVGGDFNANSSSQSYNYIVNTAKFTDTRVSAELNRTPLMCSARVWGQEANWNNGKKTPIDHIFCYGSTAVADEWTVLTDTYDKDANISTELGMIGVNYDLSDHQGIYVKLKEILE